VNLAEAKIELRRRLQCGAPGDEESVILGWVDGAEVCLMGWEGRPERDVMAVETHANVADSMQIVLGGEMEIYYPGDGTRVTLREGDAHVVPGGAEHSCVSSKPSLVLVVVGHRANS